MKKYLAIQAIIRYSNELTIEKLKNMYMYIFKYVYMSAMFLTYEFYIL